MIGLYLPELKSTHRVNLGGARLLSCIFAPLHYLPGVDITRCNSTLAYFALCVAIFLDISHNERLFVVTKRFRTVKSHSPKTIFSSQRILKKQKSYPSQNLRPFFRSSISFFQTKMNPVFSKERALSDKMNTPTKKTPVDSKIDRALTPNTTANTNLDKKTTPNKPGPLKRKRNDDSTASPLFECFSSEWQLNLLCYSELKLQIAPALKKIKKINFSIFFIPLTLVPYFSFLFVFLFFQTASEILRSLMMQSKKKRNDDVRTF